jgi:serine/threonine protein kinase
VHRNYAEHISDALKYSSAIMKKFAGNGSLASHLPPMKCRLSAVNRMTKTIAGLVRAMRFLHSQGIIHRDLKANIILLDWGWNLRIADFGYNISPAQPNLRSPSHFNGLEEWPSINSCYRVSIKYPD